MAQLLGFGMRVLILVELGQQPLASRLEALSPDPPERLSIGVVAPNTVRR